MKMSNPYYNRGMLPADSEMFFGREKVMRRIESLLNRDNPQCVAIVGERRIGKSSLANRIYHNNKGDEKTLSLYLDCGGLPDSIQTKDQFFQWLNRQFMESLEEKLGLKETLLDGEVLFGCYSTFKAFLKKCGKEGIKTLIFMDEFEELLNHKDKKPHAFADDSFFSNLRALCNDSAYRIAFVTITQSKLKELTHRSIQSSGFWNIFEDEIIGLLDHKSIEDLRSYGFEKAGFSLTKEEKEKIHYYAGDFPFFNQETCSFYWNIKCGDGIDDWDNFEVKLFPFYQKLWEDRSQEEQKLLKKPKKKKAEIALNEMAARGILLKKNGGYLPFSGHFARSLDKDLAQIKKNPRRILSNFKNFLELILKVKEVFKG